ncbi:D-glycero-beta-D-manno-heptose-1,7-bisphosphate 7-phosphatase [Gammaproteobacteria bacterium]
MAVIVLDRDGVINYDSKDYIKSPEEFILIPGSLEAIASLFRAGHQIFIATNQSGLARGFFDLPTLSEIHKKLEQPLEKLGAKLSGIFCCPHGPWEDCNCRKPRPGMYQAISGLCSVPATEMYCVGDSLRDIQAARAVGATAVLVLTGNGKKVSEKEIKGIMIFDDLLAFSKHFLESKKLA